MVTKEMLQELRAKRNKLDTSQDYTPDNAAYADIGSKLDAQREKDIKLAERAMRDAQRDMRREYQLARYHGQAKAHFNFNDLPTTKPTKEIAL